ncbi:MAG TPA: hypothetical protein VH912_24035 [Streptosporangiaceae bacterium]
MVGGTNGVVPFDAAPLVEELLELLELLDDELCDPLDELDFFFAAGFLVTVMLPL